jgi:uncharacterized membrane protein
MNRSAPRSIDQYLRQLREQLAGADPALIQDALYDSEEYLRAEVGAHPDKSEADVLELIASTYGSPEEVAAAYRDTEIKVSAAMASPRKKAATGLGVVFNVFLDPRAYTSLFFMFLSLVTGIIYFTFAVVGLSLSAGLSVLIIGIPFFLAFVAISRVVSLAEGRLLEAMTGVRMPRRPVYSSSGSGFWFRIGEMLKDSRTWSTLAYLILMLPLGIVYFVVAVVGLALGLSFVASPFLGFAIRSGWLEATIQPEWIGTWVAAPVMLILGILVLTLLMHLARGVGKLHAHLAKALLVAREPLGDETLVSTVAAA